MLEPQTPQIFQKPEGTPIPQKSAPIDEASIKTMPLKYIGAPAGKPPVVREIIEKKTVVVPAPKPSSSPPRPPAKKSNKRTMIIIAGALVLLAGIGAAAYILLMPAPKTPPTPTLPVCGNNKVETGEACDLGSQNGVTDSGCSSTCKIVAITPPPPPPVCGNSIVETGEACDLGVQNGVSGSGCSATCVAESKTPPPPPNTGIDSDSDGLTDIEETSVYGTDPHKLDTDGDTFNDGNEVSHLYDPSVKAPALLKSSEAMSVVDNMTERYSVMMPAKWTRSGQDAAQLVVSAPTGEFFQVLETLKPQEQSLVEWYLSMSPGASEEDVERFKTLQGYDALRSPDRLTTYVDSGDGRLFTLTYSYDDQTKLEFRTTYEAFLGGFLLVK